MDPLGITASIVAVLQLTVNAIGYLKDVKDSSETCQKCAAEASNLNNLLINLLYHLNQKTAGDDWYTAIRALNVENGPLDQYAKDLTLLLSRVEALEGFQKIKRQLMWKFSKEEIAGILARMERLKSLVNIALEMDHFKLSQAIHQNTLSIQGTPPTLQTDVAAIRDTQNQQQDAQRLQQHEGILQWLSAVFFVVRIGRIEASDPARIAVDPLDPVDIHFLIGKY
ncbi:MAG: hypothetical protein M1820_010768, partial [Bogoriella megaspora]